MSSAALFLLVAAGAAILGSVALWVGHHWRRPAPPDFNDHLRALAPRNRDRTPSQSSGIVPYEPGRDEEH